MPNYSLFVILFSIIYISTISKIRDIYYKEFHLDVYSRMCIYQLLKQYIFISNLIYKNSRGNTMNIQSKLIIFF